MKSATAIDRQFLLVIPYFTDFVVCSVALLGWIIVLNKGMSNLDSLTCAGIASVKKNLWHFPKSKLAAGPIYCYLSQCPFGSFPWSVLEGPKLSLRGPGLCISHVRVTMKHTRSNCS